MPSYIFLHIFLTEIMSFYLKFKCLLEGKAYNKSTLSLYVCNKEHVNVKGMLQINTPSLVYYTQ